MQGMRELLEVQSSDAVVIKYRNDQTNNMQKPITCPRSDKVSHSCDKVSHLCEVKMGIWNPETIKLVFLGDILGSLYKVILSILLDLVCVAGIYGNDSASDWRLRSKHY
jgi:hypothetical protein